MEEEYEILPKSEIDELKREVKHIKENPLGDKVESHSLLDSMEKLTIAINSLLKLFEMTQKELAENYRTSNPTETLNEILDQNHKIAKGTLAVANLVKAQQTDINKINATLNNNASITSNQLNSESSLNPLASSPESASSLNIQNMPPPPLPPNFSTSNQNNVINNSQLRVPLPNSLNSSNPLNDNLDFPSQDPFANEASLNNLNNIPTQNSLQQKNPFGNKQ